MHVSSLKLAAFSALVPILAAAVPLGPRNEGKPFYLKPEKDEGKVMAVHVNPGQQLSGGALVSIQAVDGGEVAGKGTIYDEWAFADSGHTQLKLDGTEFCLDATIGDPASFTQMTVWPCQRRGFPAQTWNTSTLVTFADGFSKIKLSIDDAKQCLDWKDGSTHIAQTYNCEDANRNQHWLKTNDKRFVAENDGLTTTILLGQASQSAVATATLSSVQAGGTVSSVFAGQQQSSSLGQATSTTASLDGNAYLSSSIIPLSTGSSLGNGPQVSSTAIASSSLGPAAITTASSDLQVQPEATGIISSLAAEPNTVTVNQGATTVVLLPSSTAVVVNSPSNIVTIVNGPSAHVVSTSIVAQVTTVDPAKATSTAHPSSSMAPITQTVQ